MHGSKALILIALTLQTGALSAQEYRRVRGDTLRYRETSTQTTQSDMQTGPVTVGITFDGVVALTFLRGDTAHMWYDTVNAKIDSPMGDVGPDLARQLVKKPFVLRFAPNGRVSVLSAPTVESPGGPTTMQRGFNEWFPRLPAQALTVGTEWQDTLVENVEPAAGLKTQNTTVMRYRVTGDSTAAGLRVLVIEASGTAESKGNGDMGGIAVSSTGKSEISGTVLFAPNPGILVSRSTRTKQDGTTEMVGRLTMTLPTHTQLETRVELIRK